MQDEELARVAIKAAIEVHRTLGGPGLLEGIYERALAYELSELGVSVVRQSPIPVRYKRVVLPDPLYLDLLLNDRLIIEVKACEDTHVVHRAQLLTYLRLTGLHLGLLINFGKPVVKDGISRVVN